MNEPAFEVSIGDAEADQRLDRYLRKLLAHVPLGAIFKHLRAGRIRVDGRKARPELRLAAGMSIELRLPEVDLEQVARAQPRRSQAPGDQGRVRHVLKPRVVYRDDDVLVVDKPAGLAVHGDKRGGDSLASWLDHKGYGVRTATFAPAPAHRLDRATSGLVAVGLSPAALRGLTAAFRDGEALKTYVAVVEGVPAQQSGAIDAPLEPVRNALGDEPKVRVAADGQSALTEWRVVQAGADRAVLRVVPRTGRTHQIRAHLRHIGHPILGDRRYGSALPGQRMLLHAAELVIPHPTRDKPLELRAEAGPEFRV